MPERYVIEKLQHLATDQIYIGIARVDHRLKLKNLWEHKRRNLEVWRSLLLKRINLRSKLDNLKSMEFADSAPSYSRDEVAISSQRRVWDSNLSQEFHKYLLNAFERGSLTRMLKHSFDLRLDDIIKPSNFSDTISELIEFAIREGWILTLVQKTHEANPTNKDLAKFAEHFNEVR